MFKKYKKSYVVSLYEQVLSMEKTVSEVYPLLLEDSISPTVLRASSLPVCCILQYLSLHKENLEGPKRNVSYTSDFFTQLGSAVHLVVQRWMGQTGRILGNWYCPKCSYKKRMSLYEGDCPKCGTELLYKELVVKYKELSGHVDGIVLLPDENMIVLDYKTTTSSKINNGVKPYIAYEKQIKSYSHILKEEYGLPIVGSSLLYISRDNPYKYHEYPFNVEDMEVFLNSQVRQHRIAKKVTKTQNYSVLMKNKPCTSLSYYKKEMHSFEECPMLNVCFNKKSLSDTLKRFGETQQLFGEE